MWPETFKSCSPKQQLVTILACNFCLLIAETIWDRFISFLHLPSHRTPVCYLLLNLSDTLRRDIPLLSYPSPAAFSHVARFWASMFYCTFDHVLQNWSKLLQTFDIWHSETRHPFPLYVLSPPCPVIFCHQILSGHVLMCNFSQAPKQPKLTRIVADRHTSNIRHSETRHSSPRHPSSPPKSRHSRILSPIFGRLHLPKNSLKRADQSEILTQNWWLRPWSPFEKSFFFIDLFSFTKNTTFNSSISVKMF